MGKHGGPVAFDVLIESDARTGLGDDRGECGLADLERITPQCGPHDVAATTPLAAVFSRT
jgi:hypothetical protein